MGRVAKLVAWCLLGVDAGEPMVLAVGFALSVYLRAEPKSILFWMFIWLMLLGGVSSTWASSRMYSGGYVNPYTTKEFTSGKPRPYNMLVGFMILGIAAITFLIMLSM